MEYCVSECFPYADFDNKILSKWERVLTPFLGYVYTKYFNSII